MIKKLINILRNIKSSNIPKDKFTIKVPDWTKININNAKFILGEAKDYVKYLNDASDKITNRAFAILAILIPITSALTIFIINEQVKPVDDYKDVCYLLYIVIIGLIAIMFGLSKIVFPRMFMPLGREPKDLCTKSFLGIDIEIKLAELSIILNEIEAAQLKIDYNEKQVSNRTYLLKFLMLSIGVMLILVILTLWILLFNNNGKLRS
jgi:hypothetical protein